MQKEQKGQATPPVGRWGQREQGILRVATQLYLQGGYENISMAAVASAAGLSEGTLYNYFHDKQDLQLRVSLAAFEGHIEAAERAVAESTSLRQGLERLIAIELRLLIEAKELFRIWMREMRGSTGYTHSEARKVLRRFSSQLIHLLAKWDAAPDPSLGLSLPMARDLVFGGLEHIVWTALVQGRLEDLDVPKLSRDLAGAFMRAFGLSEGAATKKPRTSKRRAGSAGTRHATQRQR